MKTADVAELVKEFKAASALVQRLYQDVRGPLFPPGDDRNAEALAKRCAELFEVERELRQLGADKIVTTLRIEHEIKTVRSMDRHPVIIRDGYIRETRSRAIWLVELFMGAPQPDDDSSR